MNRGAMRTQTADFLSDKNQTRYSSTQYNTALGKAQEQFALDTKALWKDASYSVTAADATYDLPTDFMWEDWVKYDGVEISPISRHELQRLSGQDWTDDQGAPTNYIIDPEEASKSITFYPIPQEAKTAAMRYFPLPAAMSSDSDVPLNSSTLMVQFHLGICAFAAWLLIMGEQVTPATQAKANSLMPLYTDAVNKAIETFKNTASAALQIRGSRIWS